jgi:AraC-like DNA-binding protein
VEIVAAGALPRAFPTRVSSGLGICLKRGPAHRVTANGRELLYPSDAICVRAPGCVWSCEAAPRGFLSIDIAPQLLPPDLDPSSMRYLRPSRELDVRRAARQLCADDALASQQALAELVAAVVELAGVSGGRSLSAAGPSRCVERAQELLASARGQHIDLEHLAAEVGANKFVLIRQFRRATGTTPYSYRNLLRIERARSLLARGLGAAEVASSLGFADQAHFSRRFKRVVGMTPSSYARSVRCALAVPGRRPI